MKFIKYFAYIVVLITVMCLYSWSIYHASTGGTKLGFLKQPILSFSDIPNKIRAVIFSNEVKNIPSTYLTPDPNFTPINNLDYDLFGLTTFWNKKESIWDMKLLNFRTDSILHKWQYSKKEYGDYHALYTVSPPKHIALLKNKELIVSLTSTPNLCRMDSNSNVIWKNTELEYHHSIEFDANNNIWTCAADRSEGNSRVYTGGIVKNLSGELISYWENYIVNVNIETGEILFKKGVAKILLENGYKGLVYGGPLVDPMHINDIQPVLEDGEHWKKGDVFISVRHRSLIILYRPSTNKIIKLLQGDFLNQHDIDILSNHEISIFNNNYIVTKGYPCKIPYTKVDSLNASEVMIYDFEKDSFQFYLKEVFLKEKIKTEGQGLSQFLSNGDLFVEETDDGTYYILNEDDIVMRKVFTTPNNDYVYMPLWVRVYEVLPN